MSNEPHDQLVAALVDHPWGDWAHAAHSQHKFDGGCAICRGDVSAIVGRAVALGWCPPPGRIETSDYPLMRVTWVDAHNNQGAWMTREELAAFAADEAYRVTQVGYKVHEDDLCIVLAARLSTPSADYGQSFGMCERIPRKLIDAEEVLR